MPSSASEQALGELQVMAGTGTAEMTPAVGIYARQWAAATQDIATGVHRPLSVRAVAFSSHAVAMDPAEAFVVLAFDLCEWVTGDDERAVRAAVIECCRVAPERLWLHCTHTHAAPPNSSVHAQRPGGHLITDYLDRIAGAAVAAATQALTGSQPAQLRWSPGQAVVARQRDEYREGRWLVGRADDVPADQTVMVGRLTGQDDVPLATIVNFACHGTALGPANTLISPDFVGALRDLVESVRGGICIFWQGASGDLAPTNQYAADPAVADQVGRSVGYSVLATLEAMDPPGSQAAFDHVLESGAPLGVWTQHATEPAQQLGVESHVLRLPSQEGPLRSWSELPDQVRAERRQRQGLIAAASGATDDDHRVTVLVSLCWLGDVLLVAVSCEAYSWLQRHLRSEIDDAQVLVLNLTNGGSDFYLPPAELYDHDMYAVWQTPAGAGGLEAVAAFVLDRHRRRPRPDPVRLPTRRSRGLHG